MQKRISLLLILATLLPGVAAQQKARDKAQGVDAAQRKLEEAQRKTQAIDILKGVVQDAADIQDYETRVSILAGALNLLWKHDETYARAGFVKAAAALSDRFASSETEKEERQEIRASLGGLLMEFGRHDPQAAAQLLDKFQKLIEEVLKGTSLSLSERLSIAQSSLESDPAQSTALAAKVIEAGVPGSFPAYLNKLEQRDAAAAASLFNVALSILAGGRTYTAVHATVLSTYVFREVEMSLPMIRAGDAGALEFGMFASPLSPPSKELNRTLASAYLAASGTFLNTKAIGLEQLTDPDATEVAFGFFLVKKLRGYVDRLGFERGQDWAVLDAKYAILAERAKLNERALNDLAATAQRIVTESTIFRFDGGEADFTAAEKTNDPARRAELLATGIRDLIAEGKYAEAIQKLTDLRDEKLNEQLNTYLSFHMAHASIKKLDWNSFNSQINRVSDVRLRSFLLLSAAQAASNAKQKKTSSEFLLTAMALFPKIENTEARAAASVMTAGILYATGDASWGAQVLSEAVNAINRADRYRGEAFSIALGLPKYVIWFPLPDSDLNHCFEQAAKHDWQGAVVAAQSIQAKALRAQAYIAACRSLL